MPKIAGLNVVGLCLASVAFFFVGFLWYGVIFSEGWAAAQGVVESDVEDDSAMWMAGGFLITLMQVIGIAIVLKWRNVRGPLDAVVTALILWAVFALPFVHYDYLYLPAHNATLLMIDGSHLLVGWAVSALVLSMFR